MNTRVRLLAGLLAAAVLAAGCGSRANFGSAGGTAAPGSGGDQSLGPTAPTGGSAPANGTTSTTVGATTPGGGAGGAIIGGTPADNGTTPSSASPAPAGSPSGSAPPSAGGPPIRVGYVITDTAGVSAVTGSSVAASTTAQQKEMQALITYANSQGGVGGRKLIGVPTTIETTSTDTQRLAACTSMTEDLHDQVVIDQNLFVDEALWSCLAEHHVDFVGNATGTDQKFLASVAPYITTTYMALDREMTALVNGTASVGYFKSAKVGIVLPDQPDAHTDYANVLAPALAAQGITNPEVRYVTIVGSNSAEQASQTTSAVLDFNSKHINRVLFFQDILVYLAFTNEAAAQGYSPQYAFPDYEDAAGVAAFYGSPAQNANSLAVSTWYVQDNADTKSTDTTKPIDRSTASAGLRRCLDVLSQELHTNYYDPTASGSSGVEIYYCDEFFTWLDAARLLGSSWTPANFGAGLKALGTSEQSPVQHSVDFSSGHNDGASSYRVGRFNSSCQCYVAVTSWLPVAT